MLIRHVLRMIKVRSHDLAHRPSAVDPMIRMIDLPRNESDPGK